MKITCQACAAKYTIADDKVLGKVVKIRCKKCGSTIVVNGSSPAAAGTPAPSQAFDYGSQGGSQEEWTVNVADGDQRTMGDAQLVDAYRAGVINDETFCWKDGMGDWLPLREIDDLYNLCNSTRAVAPPSHALGGGADEDDGGATRVQDSGPGLFAAAAAGRPYSPPAAERTAQNGLPSFADAAPLAARRPGGRAPGADLFSSAAQAGSEEDVMTSAPAGMPQPHDDDGKLTGARNENSVLFSLNALTSKGGPQMGGGGGGGGGGGFGSSSSHTASSEASGLIDIRQLSSQMGMGEDAKKRSRIDDIMNLGGGGAFAPSLGAPVLQAPPMEEYSAPDPGATVALAAASPAKSKALIFGAIGAGVIVVAGAIGGAVMLMRGKDTDTDKPAASASASAGSDLAAASPSGAAGAVDPSAAGSAAAAASGQATAPSATAAATTTSTAAATDTAPTAKPTATAAATTPPAATTAKPAATAAATTAAAAPTPPPAAAPAAAGADQPFNMGEAKARLAAVAGSVQSCKKGDASGSGRVVVTFAPNGGASSAVVSGAGFDGTPTGACVAGRFRGVRVPPFSGSPFSVSKSFVIN